MKNTKRAATKATSEQILDATILHVLADHRNPETPDAIAAHVMVPRVRVLAACERLYSAGKLARIGTGYKVA